MSYFSCKIHPIICVHCGRSSALLPDTPEVFRNANALKQKFALKKTKRKQVLELDLSSKEKKKEKAIRETKRKVGFIYDLIVELILVCKVKLIYKV